MTTISQKMYEEAGHEVNLVEAWVHTHRGPDENNPLTLNTLEATNCLVRYTKMARELNGEGFDWKKDAVSSKSLYDYSLRKPHGRWSLFNGMVNDTEIIAEVKAAGASSAACKRLRAERPENELCRESEKTRKAEAYANNVLSWGARMYEHCHGIQKLLESSFTDFGN